MARTVRGMRPCCPQKVAICTQVVFAALLGFFVLGQVPDLYSVIGYVIIIGVAVWSFLRSKVDSHAE